MFQTNSNQPSNLHIFTTKENMLWHLSGSVGFKVLSFLKKGSTRKKKGKTIAHPFCLHQV